MTRFRFWQLWLFWTSILFAAFGVVFAVWGANPAFNQYNIHVSEILLDRKYFPPDAEQLRKFIWAPLGGTIAAAYILTAWIAWLPFRNREKWALYAIITAFSAWVILDSAACIYYHVYFQVWLINGFSITVKALPILFTWKDFEKAKQQASFPA